MSETVLKLFLQMLRLRNFVSEGPKKSQLVSELLEKSACTRWCMYSTFVMEDSMFNLRKSKNPSLIPLFHSICKYLIIACEPASTIFRLGDCKFLQSVAETKRSFGLLAIVNGIQGTFPEVENSFKFVSEETSSFNG